jgi:thiol-disulfide isomerase/thioredoxin
MPIRPRRFAAPSVLALLVLAAAACRQHAPAAPAGPPLPPPVTSLGRFKAVLVNGGGRKESNFQSHLTHVRSMVDFLLASGVGAEDIVIFSGDGPDPAADLAIRATNPLPNYWLLPRAVAFQLRPRIEYIDSTVPGFDLRPATQEAMKAWFAEQGRSLAAGDTLLFYVTDHGEHNKKDPTNNTIVLWKESLNVSQLRELLGSLDPKVRVVMLMSQCFSGAFANTIFTPGNGLATSGARCGYFASSADRPAYGCYPENLGKDGVGHSHHFVEALTELGRLPEAENRVLATDDSPDVPNTTSDFLLEQLIAREAERTQQSPTIVSDELIAVAFKDRGQWEAEIRRLDRIGSTFGMFSPRSLAELEQQTTTLPQVSEQLRTYAQRWQEALESLTAQNFERFLTAQPAWRDRLSPKILGTLDDAGRLQLATELLAALVPFTDADRETHERLLLLKQRADEASAAAYRMEVRLGVVLRMRALLNQIAGRVYLARSGTPAERQQYATLRACEDVNFLAEPAFASAAAMNAPERFPQLVDDRQVVEAVMPAWMGIQFKPLSETARKREQRAPGAVTVLTVYEDSAAAAAGLEVGDVILGPPGQPFREPHQVREWTMRREIGEPAPLEVVHGGVVKQITLHPQPYPIEMPELPGPPAVGSQAPPVQKVETFRGPAPLASGPKLLFFWATWCVPCKFALPEVMAFAEARHVPVLAITDEESETLQAFFAGLKEPFPETVLMDPYRAAFQAYGVSGTPTFVYIDATGAVRYYRTGYDAAKGLEIEGWDYTPPKKKG